MLRRFFLLLALLLAPLRVEAAGNHLTATLLAESATPKPGSRITLALSMTPEKGWHGYWENPGDAGVPTSVEWSLPDGAKIYGLRYPVPQRLLLLGLMNYVYEAPYALLTTIDVPASLKPGQRFTVAGDANWLVCSASTCVPEKGRISIDLVAGDGAVDPATRGAFDRWRAALPLPLSQPARFEKKGDRIRLAIPYPAAQPVADPYFYPAIDGVIDYAAPQSISRNGDQLIVEAKAKEGGSDVVGLSGVIATGEGRGLSVQAAKGPVPAAGIAIGAGGDGKGFDLRPFLIALGGALLGGLLLNVMPCVFPILSLKALSLAKAGGSEARVEALSYAAGVILSCIALGGLILGLRAGGSMVGWAFQLQDPRVIAGLLLLMTAISLNMAGLFELRTIGVGDSLTHGKGAMPAFWTGVLAALVATPCTGPFMAGALGAALVLPAAAAIAVFAGLGFGLALPFIVIGFVPALRRKLPKPGPWMETLRHILAVPMFATALGLAWILGRQAGVDGMVLGLGAALLLGLALWWAGARQAKARRFAFAPLLPALAIAGAAALLVPKGSAVASVAKVEGEAFDEAKLASLTAEGKPVFLYFTADWCLTCKVNEKAAIDRDEVRAAFKQAGVTVMIGDWTDGNPAIGRFLEAKGRSGVPLYLFYHRDGKVETLPQLLTPATLTGLRA
ncbi:protein-disulfide reductase DsbD family protein [Sphingomonas montanisoli]|uniref:Thiol:disulfide interchange protein n=1 Tax=Sphingomonas montanisoli TaxID=2606412 RepID=A0A5D9CAR7_9SPHN|nr:thioredoxin family protein [Sphingomonas montanisoli]TZG29038.1 thiol:disulfide interchange protein [Sphingomonas montanisoli]